MNCLMALLKQVSVIQYTNRCSIQGVDWFLGLTSHWKVHLISGRPQRGVLSFWAAYQWLMLHSNDAALLHLLPVISSTDYCCDYCAKLIRASLVCVASKLAELFISGWWANRVEMAHNSLLTYIRSNSLFATAAFWSSHKLKPLHH